MDKYNTILMSAWTWFHAYRISFYEITVDPSPKCDSVTKMDQMQLPFTLFIFLSEQEI